MNKENIMEDIYKNAFLNRYLSHIRRVQDNMIMLDNNLSKLDLAIDDFELFRRAMFHDIDKLQPKMMKYYVEASKYYYNKRNNVKYDFDLEKYYKITEIHYSTQRHHFYKNEIQNPSDVDICEMCCDITAVSIEKKEQDNIYYYKNYMLKEYNKLAKYNDKILSVFNILWKLQENFIYENEKKYKYIKNKIEKIRTFQDTMIFLEKNIDKLPFKIKNYEIFKRAICLNNGVFDDEYTFFDTNGKISELEICVFCSEYFKNKNFDAFVENNEKLKMWKKDIEKICDLLMNGGKR